MVSVRPLARRWGAYTALGIALAFAPLDSAPAQQQGGGADNHHTHPVSDAKAAQPAPIAIAVTVSGQLKMTAPEQHELVQQPQENPLSTLLHFSLTDLLLTLFTGALAFLTWQLIIVGQRQHQAARDALELARKEFIASHRPSLRVRRIWPIGKSQPFMGKALTEIRFIVANVGYSEAKIVRMSG